jgi:hypothetical protein
MDKLEFINKWSNWFRFEKQAVELKESFERELNEVIIQSNSVSKKELKHPAKFHTSDILKDFFKPYDEMTLEEKISYLETENKMLSELPESKNTLTVDFDKVQSALNRNFDNIRMGAEHVEFLKELFASTSKLLSEDKDDIYDLTELPEKEKQEFLENMGKSITKNLCKAFISLGLKTHIHQLIICNEVEYLFRFETVEFAKNNNFFHTTKKQYEVSCKWISVYDGLPKENEIGSRGGDFTNCIAYEIDIVHHDAVFHHPTRKFYHNQDTSLSSPIKATHWMLTYKSTSNK